MKNNKDLIYVARQWIGTKFHINSALKKNQECCGGCDCIGLVFGVLKECGHDLLPLMKNYRYKENQNLINFSDEFFSKEDFKNKNQLKSGQIACFEIEKNFFHLGFISEIYFENISNSEKKFSFIHAFSKVGFVTETILDNFWMKKLKFLFEIKNS